MHLFQSRVDKVADIRLTAVGDRLFAVRIDGAPGLDWRRSYEDLDYRLIDPPPDVAKGVHDYLAAFGLTYGAFDFGLDAAGRWHWYECNPNGQFAWFPDPVTDRITAALADRLQYPTGTADDQQHTPPPGPRPRTRRTGPAHRSGMARRRRSRAPRTVPGRRRVPSPRHPVGTRTPRATR
ncbi:hypothetical protein ACR6C2_40095 [Streptomyces sp. INA 01156]